jgi:hypothetical protein
MEIKRKKSKFMFIGKLYHTVNSFFFKELFYHLTFSSLYRNKNNSKKKE